MKSIAIITGVSRGIGAASATAFRDRGWTVLGLSRTSCPVDGVDHLSVDLLAEGWVDSVSKRLATLLSESPSQICLIHNAAMMVKDTAVSVDPSELRSAFELNVVVPTMLNALVRPYMGPTSSILYIGSTLATKAVANTASYVMTKHAIAGLMKATCQDLGGTGIHTACICPGFTATEMLLSHIGEDAETRTFIESLSTFGRLINPNEIAETLFFCAENPVINGALLHANLGQVER